jgi:CelD/BcsL family acetyltransferase involved in cellulose biosynthesis
MQAPVTAENGPAADSERPVGRDDGPATVLQGFGRLVEHKVAGDLFAQGRLRLSTLSVGGRPVASVYALASGRTVAAYQSGFDVTFDSKISLGLVAYSLAMEDSVRRGHREWDFLRGLEPYKSWWPVVARRYEDTRAWNRGARASASWCAFTAEQAARRVVRHARGLLSRGTAGDPR